MVSQPSKRSSFPKRKISETFIDFAEPLVSIIDQDTTEDQIKAGFQLACTVWNAVVFDKVNGNDHYVSWINDLISDDLQRALVNQLVVRKKEFFGEDQRVIGNYTVTYSNGELHVWAEARAPKPSS